MEKIFILEPTTGSRWRYADLWECLRKPAVSFCPRLRPSSLGDFGKNIMAALGGGHDITLFDPSFSEAELRALGHSEVELCYEEVLPTRHSATSSSDLLQVARGESSCGVVLFTSGSTGLPKAVRQPISNLCRAVRLSERHCDDVWGFAYNPAHIAGVQVFFQAVFNENPLVDLRGQPRDMVLESIRRHRITHLSATPTFYRLLLPVVVPLESVLAITLGGERTEAGLIERLRPIFPNARFRNLYASTEAGTLLSSDGEVFSIPESMQQHVRVVDGRLQVHVSFLGEFPAAERVVGDWYDTGDVVESLSGDWTRFRIVSRDRDWINVGGNKVNPAEVEAVLREHPSVREARVYGRPHALLGRMVCADVLPAGETASETELRQFLSGRLQPFKLPRLIRVVASMATTRTGKLKRYE